MNQKTHGRHAGALALSAACLLVTAACAGVQAAPPPPSAKPSPAPVEAQLYSTMPSTRAYRPEMAMDGDAGTYFKTAYGMDDGDDFLVRLGRPIPLQALRITTGDAEGQDLLANGFVEVSPDGVHFRKAASFSSAGVAQAALANVPVQAVRIRVNPGQEVPALLVREITLTSPVKISHAQQGPGRGFPDLSQTTEVTPALKAWAQKAERQMEAFWPDTSALLYTDNFIPPNMVNVVYRTGPDVTGIAATGGGVMTVNTVWCARHPEDTPLTVHEMAHVIQAYSGYNPVWLVEGIADYIRWVKFEPEHFHPRINVQKATYHDAYQTTATFLAWCEQHYDPALVTKLSRAVRFGSYNNSLFKTYCGKDVDTLWSEFIAAYQADPVNIITPPLAAADRPRVLPNVAAGASVPISLASAFDTSGIASDGTPFSPTSGTDAGGMAYSSALLGPAPTDKNVQFRLGPANAPDVVTCHGNTIPLPAGMYASLWLLGAATDGAQSGQSLTVTYTDGTKDTLAQSFSDWFHPQGFPGESRAVTMPYRNTAGGAKDTRTFYAYSYGFSLNPQKTVQSLTLPDNSNVKILAASLAH